MLKLSVVIPVWNEEKTLETLVEKVLSLKDLIDYQLELVIVNDGSTDHSWEILQKLAYAYPESIKIHTNEKNVGKSQTVKNGILQSTGDFVIIQDADLEYLPSEIPELIKTATDKNLDVVYGNRFGKKSKVIYWQNYYGNKFLSALSNIFTYPRIHVWIPDMEVCYKLMRGDVARKIAETITSKSTFGLEPELTAKLSKIKINKDGRLKHLRFGVIPVSYFPRTIEEGKKMNAFKDGFKALGEILRYNI